MSKNKLGDKMTEDFKEAGKATSTVVLPVVDGTISFSQDAPKIPTVYDRKAFSTFKTSTGWHLVEIPFNTNTFEVGTPVIVLTNTEQLEVEFQFQVKSSQELFD